MKLLSLIDGTAKNSGHVNRQWLENVVLAHPVLADGNIIKIQLQRTVNEGEIIKGEVLFNGTDSGYYGTAHLAALNKSCRSAKPVLSCVVL